MILSFGVYFHLQEARAITTPKFPTKHPNHRIFARQKSRFTHDYFYIRGPIVMRVATFTRTTSTGTASSNRSSIGRRLVFERMTTPSWLSTMLPHCRRLQTGLPRNHSQEAGLLDLRSGSEVLRERAQEDQSVALLMAPPARARRGPRRAPSNAARRAARRRRMPHRECRTRRRDARD